MTRFGGIALAAAAGLAAALALLLGLAGVTALRALFLGLNASTMLCYGWDKHLARSRAQRVPEAALHILSAAGGSPGALAGQWLFRHKTRDSRFQAVFLAIVAVQVVVLLAIRRSRGL